MTAIRRPNRRHVPEMAAIAMGEICHRTRKVRYIDERTALRGMEQVSRRDPSRARLNAFECEHCGDWHVGHRPKEPSDAD